MDGIIIKGDNLIVESPNFLKIIDLTIKVLENENFLQRANNDGFRKSEIKGEKKKVKRFTPKNPPSLLDYFHLITFPFYNFLPKDENFVSTVKFLFKEQLKFFSFLKIFLSKFSSLSLPSHLKSVHRRMLSMKEELKLSLSELSLSELSFSLISRKTNKDIEVLISKVSKILKKNWGSIYCSDGKFLSLRRIITEIFEVNKIDQQMLITVKI